MISNQEIALRIMNGPNAVDIIAALDAKDREIAALELLVEVERAKQIKIMEGTQEAVAAHEETKRQFDRAIRFYADEHKESRAENERLRGQYEELLYAVSQKHEGETRHQTALRYIREREAASTAGTGAKRVQP
jgi:hypothetical protein